MPHWDATLECHTGMPPRVRRAWATLGMPHWNATLECHRGTVQSSSSSLMDPHLPLHSTEPLPSSFQMGERDPQPDPQATHDLSRVLLPLGLAVLAVAAAGINSLVITAILATRRLRSPANYLICSLALTDLLVAVLVMPVSIVYIGEERWALGTALCHLWLGVDVTCCTCSILHLAAIAIDRYRAITDAVAYSRKRTARHALLTISAVWLLSVLVSLPPLVWRRQDEGRETEGGVTQCLMEHDHVAFTVYSTFGAFYIPLLLILVLYYRIYHAAQTLRNRHGSRLVRCTVSSVVLPGGEGSGSGSGSGSGWERDGTLSPVTLSPVTLSPTTERSFSELQRGDRPDPHHGRRRRRAALTLGLILGAFVVCWLPFFLKEVIVNSCPSCGTSAAVADGLTWLGYLNSLINPLIYTVFNEDFKKAFKRLLAFHCNHYR
ncbi:5-hydroxytryptamine receptor 1F [Clupea harengus]|uniref:5-hydroxytryptamine receptor 1F n=1 Tax=Clupea harengus TaxID=7950 RepID=A0A6P8EU88_CLUHA|nr:5-hydroxytryptamine receptor 1F [Clupea harengus]